VRSVSPFLAEALAGSPSAAGALGGGVVRRGSGKARGERARKGPGRCRVCRKGLVTAPERTLGRCQSCPADLNADLLDALREWRLETSREKSVPAYVVFTDNTLIAIAEQSPADGDALAEIPGIGPMKLQAYGEDLLGLVRQHA
jgi:DNA helicase-2/ATP-dependent DNA helicase PcrA